MENFIEVDFCYVFSTENDDVKRFVQQLTDEKVVSLISNLGCFSISLYRKL